MILPVFFCKVLVSRSWELTQQGYRISDNQKTVKKTSKYPNSALNLGLGWNWIDEESGFSGGIYLVSIIPFGMEYEPKKNVKKYVCVRHH